MSIESAVAKRAHEAAEADRRAAALRNPNGAQPPKLVPDPYRPGAVVRESLANVPPEGRLGAAFERRRDAEAEARKPADPEET